MQNPMFTWDFFLPISCQSLKYCYFCHGELAEWSIAAVLKTVVPQGTVGSNPTFSAKTNKCPIFMGHLLFTVIEPSIA